MKIRFALISLLVVVVVVLSVFWARGRSADDARNQESAGGGRRPPTVRVAPAARTTISHELELTGSVEPYRIARLASPAEGPVVAVHVREADPVEAGDVLASIGRKRGVDALIASLREELDQEQDNLLRTKQLVDSEAIPSEEYDLVRAAVERVRAQLIRAEETARDFDIVAPWDGVVSRLLVREGEFVSPRAAILEIYDPSSLEIRAAVAEQYAVEIAPGMRVEVRLDAYPGREFMGRVARVYPYLDSRMRTRTFEIVLDEDPDLLPGMFARVDLSLRTVTDAVVVPIEAVVASGRGPVVFVVEDGKAVGRSVETGIEQENAVEIRTGIRPGDQVVVAGNQKLKDGAAVQLQNAGSGPRQDGDAGRDGPSAERRGAGGGAS